VIVRVHSAVGSVVVVYHNLVGHDPAKSTNWRSNPIGTDRTSIAEGINLISATREMSVEECIEVTLLNCVSRIMIKEILLQRDPRCLRWDQVASSLGPPNAFPGCVLRVRAVNPKQHDGEKKDRRNEYPTQTKDPSDQHGSVI